jgi:hypothetical protein
MQFRRLLERTPSGPVLHLDGNCGDARTLCGYAYEGECAGDTGGAPVTLLSQGRVTCADCLSIVRYAKTIPARYLKE